MSEEVTFVPTPVVKLAFACIDELAKAGLLEAGTNADHLVVIMHALQSAEARGAIVFADEQKPGYEASQPSPSMVHTLAQALNELRAAVNAHEGVSNALRADVYSAATIRVDNALDAARALVPVNS